MDRRELLNDPEETTRVALDGRQASLWTALPCIVEAVHLTTMTVDLQPAIQGVTEDELGNQTYVNLPLLVDVPIVFPQGGGFLITFPLAIGDEVLAIIASRCIDAWWQSGGIGVPMEARMHDLSDAFAIPGPFSQPRAKLVAPAASSTNLQIRNTLGTALIEMTPTGAINLTATAINVTGAMTVVGEVIANGTPLSTHVHGGVQSGSSSTGVPIP